MIANAVALGFRDLIGFTLTTAAGAKLVSLDGFEMTLIGLGLLPTRGTPSRYLAIVIALAEALTGLLLISGIAPFAITIVASGMLLSFLCAILIALSRRLEIACHCFGSLTGTQFSGAGLLRVLAMLVLVVLTTPAASAAPVGAASLAIALFIFAGVMGLAAQASSSLARIYRIPVR